MSRLVAVVQDSESNRTYQTETQAAEALAVASSREATAAASPEPLPGNVVEGHHMPTWCIETVEADCPSSRFSASPYQRPTQCARFVAQDTDGVLCRTWAQTYPGRADQAKKEYCATHPNSTECLCFSRQSLPIYRDLRPPTQSADACWWKPCMAVGPEGQSLDNAIMLPAGATNNTDPACRALHTCQDVLPVAALNGVGESTLELYTSCRRQPAAPAPSPGVSGWKVFLGVLAGVIVVLALCAVVYFAYSAFHLAGQRSDAERRASQTATVVRTVNRAGVGTPTVTSIP